MNAAQHAESIAHSRTHLPAAPGDPREDTRDDTYDDAHTLGWDHARLGLTPPLERLCINPRLQRGLRAGRAAGAPAGVPPSAAQRLWLQLRLQALAEGRTYEAVQLTPTYLRRLWVPHCPVTREPLPALHDESAAPVARLRPDAGYAAGHLVWMSPRAARAQATVDAETLEARLPAMRAGLARVDGLSPSQWARVASLKSYVTPATHDAAAAQPMRVLPPCRLRLLNPAQALQAVVSRAFVDEAGPGVLAAVWRALVEAAPRAAFEAFVTRFSVALRAAHSARAGAAGPRAWMVEDAWDDAPARALWAAFARPLGAARCAVLARDVSPHGASEVPDALATAGWALERRGRVLPAVTRLPRGLPGAGGPRVPCLPARHPDAVPTAPAARPGRLPGRQIALFPLRG